MSKFESEYKGRKIVILDMFHAETRKMGWSLLIDGKPNRRPDGMTTKSWDEACVQAMTHAKKLIDESE